MNELRSPTDAQNRSGRSDASYKGYSPSGSSPMMLFDADSPSRYTSRYMERYRSIIRESPPENLHIGTPIDERLRSTTHSNQGRETKSPTSPEPYRSPAASSSMYDRVVKTLYSPVAQNNIARASHSRKSKSPYQPGSYTVDAETPRERAVKNLYGSDAHKSPVAPIRRQSDTKLPIVIEPIRETKGKDPYVGNRNIDTEPIRETKGKERYFSNRNSLDSETHKSSATITTIYDRAVKTLHSPTAPNKPTAERSSRASKSPYPLDNYPAEIALTHENPGNSIQGPEVNTDAAGKNHARNSADSDILRKRTLKSTPSTSTGRTGGGVSHVKLEDSETSRTQQKRRTQRPVGELPHYMLSTLSYQSRLKQQQHGPTRTGGIKKRVGTSKVPRFHVTTRTNAVEEIRREMTPEDVFISIAARTKQFERGLGNGVVAAPKVIDKREPTTLASARSPVPKSSQTYHSQRPDRQRNEHTPSSYQKQTEHQGTSGTKLKRKHSSSEEAPRLKKQRANQPLKVKPFHFATDERVQRRHREAFHEKLDLWKGRETQP
ncbi:hypothetical protein DFQ28_008517 [Apophysomyces sp. BC1034]|nr:hypothetical protein DFQ29_001719 [Apophysomyces sp. BC1021]KAG0185969.1 hypothetical protein DFQ28_008517 [Apophysomyces sp. BC1034]